MGGVGSREYESGLAARAHQRARGMGSSGMADTLALEPEHTFGKASSGDGRDARGRVRRPGQKFDGSAELPLAPAAAVAPADALAPAEARAPEQAGEWGRHRHRRISQNLTESPRNRRISQNLRLGPGEATSHVQPWPRFSLYLTISPHISPHLPMSPLHLP